MYTDEPITEGKLLNKYEDLRQKVVDFASYILELELEIKDIKEKIKEAKKDAKIEGVSVKLVTKTLNELKKVKRLNEGEKADLEAFLDLLGNDIIITSKIDSLTN